MRKITIALVMATIAISLLISNVFALEEAITDNGLLQADTVYSNGMDAPHPSATTAYSANYQTFKIQFTNATLTTISMYMYKFGAPIGYFGAALYSTTGEYSSSAVPNALIETSSTVTSMASISETATAYNFTFANSTLLVADTTYAFVIYEINETTCTTTIQNRIYYDANLMIEGDVGYYRQGGWSRVANVGATLLVYGYPSGSTVQYLGGNTNYFDTVLTYDLADITIASSTPDIMFFSLLVLTLVCVGLMIRSGIPLLNFVFGIMTLGIAAYSLQTPTIIFFGYIQMFAILMASLCMLSGYRSYRNE